MASENDYYLLGMDAYNNTRRRAMSNIGEHIPEGVIGTIAQTSRPTKSHPHASPLSLTEDNVRQLNRAYKMKNKRREDRDICSTCVEISYQESDDDADGEEVVRREHRRHHTRDDVAHSTRGGHSHDKRPPKRPPHTEATAHHGRPVPTPYMLKVWERESPKQGHWNDVAFPRDGYF